MIFYAVKLCRTVAKLCVKLFFSFCEHLNHTVFLNKENILLFMFEPMTTASAESKSDLRNLHIARSSLFYVLDEPAGALESLFQIRKQCFLQFRRINLASLQRDHIYKSPFHSKNLPFFNKTDFSSPLQTCPVTENYGKRGGRFFSTVSTEHKVS